MALWEKTSVAFRLFKALLLWLKQANVKPCGFWKRGSSKSLLGTQMQHKFSHVLVNILQHYQSWAASSLLRKRLCNLYRQ